MRLSNFIIVVISIFITSGIYGNIVFANSGDILEYVNKSLEPKSIQDKNEKEESFSQKLCSYIDLPLICKGSQIHDIFAPNVKTIPKENVKEDDLENIKEKIQSIENQSKEGKGNIEGTSSSRLLGVSDSDSIVDKLAKFLSPKGLFIDEKTAVTTRHLWPSSLREKLGDNAQKAVEEKIAHGMLLPAAFGKGTKITSTEQDNVATLVSPLPENPSSSTNISEVSPIVPTNTPIVYSPSTSLKTTATLYEGGGYKLYYQNDPNIAWRPLPNCDSAAARICGVSFCTVRGAGCGPLTLTNALINFGIDRLSSGETTNPMNVIAYHYPSLSSCGSSIEEGRVILKNNYGFTTEYIFADKRYKISDILSEIDPYLSHGFLIWANIIYNGYGHHMLIVGKSDSALFTLDPYYGYKKEIPFSQYDDSIIFKHAFAFKNNSL